MTYESEVVSEEDPGTQFVATGDAVGSISTTQGKHMGYVARLWKIVTVDGVEQSRDAINKSTYKSSPKIVNVGTASADPNATAAVNAALNSFNRVLLANHIKTCVTDDIRAGKEETVDELIATLQKLMR